MALATLARLHLAIAILTIVALAGAATSAQTGGAGARRTSSASAAGHAAAPVALSKDAAEAALNDIAKDRADTQKWLQSGPTSYLATIDRRDFGARNTMTVGGAADNDLRIAAAPFAAHHLRVTVDGDRFH